MTKSVWSTQTAATKVAADNMNREPVFNSMCDDAARCEMCPLSRVKTGVAVRIKRLCAAPEVQERLREIGLCEDQVIRLLTSHTNFICQVCNTRLALSEQLAQLIMVEPLSQPAIARVPAR